MARPHRPLLTVLCLAALAGATRAQLEPAREPLPRGLAGWTPPSTLGATTPEPARAPLLRWSGPRPGLSASDEQIIALFAPEPPPVTRAELEEGGAGALRYHGLPGGIVLGCVARAPAELAGARLSGSVEQGLALALADGRRIACPPIEPATLRAALAFTAQPVDALVHLVPFAGVAPRVAPAFAGGALEPLLVRLDALPHRVMPETRVWKSLIVDRAARCTLRGTELVLTADLEVRFYAKLGDTGQALHAHTAEALASDFVGPRTAPDLSDELAPLAELAGWLAFLRLAAELDPQGIAALRREAAQ
ncbi:MAG TPA: hypothetical protein VF530_06235 [Planctomycetota bacterium]